MTRACFKNGFTYANFRIRYFLNMLICPVIFVLQKRQVSYLGIDEWQLSSLLKQMLIVSPELQSMTSVLGFGTLHGVRWIHFLLIRTVEFPM